MQETTDDLARMQVLLDDTYARGGAHLRGIHTEPARLSAADLAARVTGMRVMVVATVTADGRPLTGPVDAFLFRGRVYFGTSSQAIRARHLAVRPAVSVTYVEGEGLVFTVHGQARPCELDGRDAGFRDVLVAKYGDDWGDWGAGNPYYAVEPHRMLAADMTVHTASV